MTRNSSTKFSNKLSRALARAEWDPNYNAAFRCTLVGTAARFRALTKDSSKEVHYAEDFQSQSDDSCDKWV